ncbi:hypothetical protein [Croceibacter atlanticus]|mgnify:CR=1 FL=1|uniref:hypothetical protein n=1 Tax=Croceibacter atlanticus TaxID=313588 RepID=UPI0030F720A0
MKTVIILLQFTEDAGLFDLHFTANDVVFIVVIFLGWIIRMYMERKNNLQKNPTLDDYVSSLVISYAVTGCLYQVAVQHKIEIGYVMFPMFMASILSLSFIKWLFTPEGKKKNNELFAALIQFLINKLNNFKPNDNSNGSA